VGNLEHLPIGFVCAHKAAELDSCRLDDVQNRQTSERDEGGERVA